MPAGMPPCPNRQPRRGFDKPARRRERRLHREPARVFQGRVANPPYSEQWDAALRIRSEAPRRHILRSEAGQQLRKPAICERAGAQVRAAQILLAGRGVRDGDGP